TPEQGGDKRRVYHRLPLESAGPPGCGIRCAPRAYSRRHDLRGGAMNRVRKLRVSRKSLAARCLLMSGAGLLALSWAGDPASAGGKTAGASAGAAPAAIFGGRPQAKPVAVSRKGLTAFSSEAELVSFLQDLARAQKRRRYAQGAKAGGAASDGPAMTAQES